MENLPLVSVLLPVYNGKDYLADSIKSILSQEYLNLEIIIINDGSTDDSQQLIEKFNDTRIKCLQQKNQGLAATLNLGITLARGKYIARQDQDDLSHPNRILSQLKYMEANPECVLLGTWAQIMESDKIVDRFHFHPIDEITLRYQLLFNNPFVHSSVLLRRSALLQVGGYTTDPERQPPEDFELWSRLSRIGSIANIGEVLLTYREVPGSMSRSGPTPFKQRLMKICSENIATATQLAIDDSSIQSIVKLTHGDIENLHRKPDFTRIKKVLMMAIDNLDNDDVPITLREDAANRVEVMQAAWMVRNTPLMSLINKVRPLKYIAKRVFSLMRTMKKAK